MSIPLKPKTRQRYYKKSANQLSLIKIDVKILKNIVASRVQKQKEKFSKESSSQECKAGSSFENWLV